MKKVTVWYDSACPLCRREIALVQRLDRKGRIAFIDATDPASTCPVDRAEILDRFHAEENGVLLSGAAAFGAMWRAVPLLWPLGMLAKLPPVLAVLEWAYRHFLRVRPRLQRLFT
jgi:predicted DCC family thiol-disulfide oxidoreductase YuxK